MLTRAYTDALEASLGRVVGDMQRQFDVYVAQSDAVIAGLQARAAESEFRFSALEAQTAARIDERLAAAERAAADRIAEHVATRADPAEVAQTIKGLIDGAVQAAVSAVPVPVVPDVVPMVVEAVKAAVNAIPPARDGKDADMDAVEQSIAELVAPIAARNETMAAKLAEIEAREIPVPFDPSELAANIEAVAASIPEVPELPDVPALIAEAIAALPAPVDGKDGANGEDADPAEIVALRDEIEAVRSAIPDVSIFVRADEITAPKDFGPEIESVRAAIPDPVEMPDLSGFATRDDIAEAVASIPMPRDGKDADPEEIARMVAAAIPPIETLRGPEGPAGKLGMVKAWTDRVHYEGETVTRNGATWQAVRDTGREPPHDDWICLAARGETGDAGESVEFRGTYDAAETYKRLDCVALDGSTFAAKQDDPGACPGENWQLVATRGGRGKPGENIKGDPGRDASSIVDITLDEEGVLTLKMSNGVEHKADFYPLLVQK